MEQIVQHDTDHRKMIVKKRYQKEILEWLIDSRYGSKAKLGAAIGIDRSYISQIVHEHIPATTRMKIKIAKALGVDSRDIWRTP